MVYLTHLPLQYESIATQLAHEVFVFLVLDDASDLMSCLYG
jgi:hypothetical protein